MKIGIYYAYWEENWFADYSTYVKKAARLGYDVLEISCGGIARMSPKELLDLRDLAAEKAIILTAGYGPAPEENIASQDSAIVKNAFKFWEKMFASLEALDINIVGGGLYSYWPVDYSKPIDKIGDRKRSVSNMRLLADMAEAHGITTLGMESLNRFEGYLINTSHEACEYVDEVNRPNVKVMLDTFHMNIEENDIPGAILEAGGRLGHFHVGERNRRLPGQGDLPWDKIAATLKAIGYNGFIVSEPFVKMGGRVGSDIKVWRNIIPDVSEKRIDDDAAASAAFLRGLFA